MLDRIAPMAPPQTINIASITLGRALGYVDFRLPQLHWRDGRGALGLWYEIVSARKSMQATVPHRWTSNGSNPGI